MPLTGTAVFHLGVRIIALQAQPVVNKLQSWKIHATCEFSLTALGLLAISGTGCVLARSGTGISFINRACGQPLHRKNNFSMRTVNVKKTLAAFEAKEIKPTQQLEVKGGDNGTTRFIGSEDVIQ